MFYDDQPHLILSESAYNFVSFRGQILALPQILGPLDLATADLAGLAGIFISDDLQALRNEVFRSKLQSDRRLSLIPMTSTPANAALYGSNHPAYDPIFGGSYENVQIESSPTSCLCNSNSLYSLDRTLLSFRQKLRNIAGKSVEKYIRSRDYLSLLMQETQVGVHWLQGAPLTIGAYPWMIQVENTTSLWLPFFSPTTSQFIRKDDDLFEIIRTQLTSKECVAIVSNIKAIIETLPALFDCEHLREKLYYLPFVTAPKAPAIKKRGTFLFTTSWHQHRESFYDRGRC